jgi:hypothetical protein
MRMDTFPVWVKLEDLPAVTAIIKKNGGTVLRAKVLVVVKLPRAARGRALVSREPFAKDSLRTNKTSRQAPGRRK